MFFTRNSLKPAALYNKWFGSKTSHHVDLRIEGYLVDGRIKLKTYVVEMGAAQLNRASL